MPSLSTNSSQPHSSSRPHAGGRPRMRLACAAAVASLCAALAGCGSSSPTGTAADPAGAVPPTAALYIGASVRPSGAEKTDALALGKALTHHANPYLRLLALLQTPGSAQLNFARDVAPWLGPHAGVFLTSLGASAGTLPSQLMQGLLGGSSSGVFAFGSSGAQGAIVLDTSDSAKARTFLDAQAAKAGAHAASYHGVAYEVNASGVALGLVDRFAVIGSEAGLHDVIEATHGAGALAHASGYSRLLASAPTDALAHVYVNPASFPHGSTQEQGITGLVRGLAGGHEANVSLVPAASSLGLDVDTLAAGGSGEAGGLLSADPESAQALGELPGESWFAIGVGHVGTSIGKDVQELHSLASLGSTLGGGAEESSAGVSVGGILNGLLTPLSALGAGGPQAQRELASWMGSAGIFASGGNLLELRGAVVISSKSPAASRAAVATLAAQLRKSGTSVSPVSIPGTDAAIGARITGLPVVLDIADGRDSAGQAKLVLGIGEASVATALNPSSTLAAAAPRGAAAAALGESIQPSIIVDFPTLLTLLEGIGLTEAPSISKFIPYLRATTTLAGGGRELAGGVQRFRLALGLQAPAG
ncbi:MAG TPA: DUF3352 domain-containing protein [Solirubrobacteraceae bacterium]|nr:DUF3352 domain-containing protein [Solirubrobacteraceae bacterium]